MQNVENVKINPMYVLVGSDEKQKQQILTRADLAGDLFGQYICIHDADGGNHLIYFDDVTEVIPANFLEPDFPSTGWTSHRVPIAENASSTAVATALKTAILAITGKFTATSFGKIVTYECSAKGYAHPGRDAIPTASRTGFAFRLLKVGFAEISIGAIDGDIEVSGLEQSLKEIMTHATGESAQGEIVTGYSKPEISFTQMEVDKSGLQRALVLAGGQTVLPEIEGAEVAMGYGPTAMGTQKPQFKVRLHPVANDAADRSEDLTIWKASFNLDGLKYSGTEFQTVPLKGSIYPDTTKIKTLQYFAMGDTSWMEA